MKSHKACSREVIHVCRSAKREINKKIKPEAVQALPTERPKVWLVTYRGVRLGRFSGCCPADARKQGVDMLIPAARASLLNELEMIRNKAKADGVWDMVRGSWERARNTIPEGRNTT